ncbi:sacsin N-terminal ATP-binding-like domain-containing protein [Saccharopolyspora sp. ASAGF58]|uniref:sacsin N-terminal ATP-binding-like domain-containing protein n=1 Tax=Saccharopolyspora sp. ASAGF58 TaxID=2719023 RepID=UPI0014400E9A|nr:ATP-binding protein [Saccharopolyspora sp. ASAGF58]QIZ35719.1 ATP-binding protein [Saccharopolyspora sp. ASAGF58]
MSRADPFGAAELRQAVLQSWEASPTRFREDANAEEDLRLGGYRDRLLVELAQNAADAAGTSGVLRVEFVGRELRVANTGAPLTVDGVAGLASLRASAKREGVSVGRFGVGFAAVLAVSDEPRIVSTSGGVAFSAERTREAVAELSGRAEELAAREGVVPILRLPWAVADEPPTGFDTEVRLPLRPEVDAEALLAALTDQAPDLLISLPGLTEIRIGEKTWRRDDEADDRFVVRGPVRSDRWLVHRAAGTLSEVALAGLGVEARHATQWHVTWAVPLDEYGMPIPLAEDVLHAPTPTEERLSLPARLLASVPVEPDRRRVAASAATDSVLTFAAECYPTLVGKIAAEHRTALVPLPGFPLSDVDDKLRQGVNDRLRVAAWLPAANGKLLAPLESRVLEYVSPELVELLKDVVPGLLTADLADAHHRRSLHVLEVRRLAAAEIVEAVTGLQRPPHWWYRLYDALTPIEGADPVAREEFSALPVPLADGRTVTGVRDVLLSHRDADPDPAALLSTLDISGLRIAHPEATHPLLEKLGAHPAGPAELLDAPSLEEAVRSSVSDARSGADVQPLAEAVLRLVASAQPRHWLGALALPDADGDFRRADELMLPDAALLDVLDPEYIGEDAPLAVLDEDFAADRPADLLRSIGVLDGFAVHVEEDPVEADDDFPDSHHWWAEQEAAQPENWPPARFMGIRDLDLVADDAWPAAIRLLVRNPDTLRALREPNSYSAWWIARYALIEGHPPKHWRLAGAEELAGLYDAVPDVGLDDEHLRIAGVRGELVIEDADDAEDLLERLGDPDRAVRAGTALRAHQALTDAVAGGVVDPGEFDPPEMVRSVSGAVVSTGRAVVLDEPWMLGVLEAPLVIAGGSPDQFDAEALAELLDLPLASEENTMQVVGPGRLQRWPEVARVPAACELLGITVPTGEVTLHDVLKVRSSAGEQRVHWWVESTGKVHAERTPDGLARALAWASGAWHERFALTALLADPEAATLLR